MLVEAKDVMVRLYMLWQVLGGCYVEILLVVLLLLL